MLRMENIKIEKGWREMSPGKLSEKYLPFAWGGRWLRNIEMTIKKCSGEAPDKKEEFEGQLCFLEIPKMLKIGLPDVL